MAKATLTTNNGTEVNVDGTPEEIARLLALYNDTSSGAEPKAPKKKRPGKRAAQAADAPSSNAVHHLAIVNAIRDSDQFDQIEATILDKKDQLNRALLPLYAVHEFMESNISLTTGDIEKVLTELGNRVKSSNIAGKLRGSKYVTALAIRRNGEPTPYRIHRHGIKYIESVLDGGS